MGTPVVVRRNLALLAVAALAACGGGPAAPGATGQPGASQGAVEGSPAALVVTAVPDLGAAAEGVVDVAGGGTIEATAEDGTRFRLEVPPGAVPVTVAIRLTPLRDVRVLDGAGPVHGVRLEPDGLEFFALVRLTIVPATPIPLDQQLALVTDAAGGSVELALVDPASEPVVLLLEHFSQGLVGRFTPEQQAVMKSKSAANAERRIANEMRDRIGRERNRQLRGESDSETQPDVSDLVDEFEREVVDKRREAAALSCDHLYAYVKTLISFERQLQLLGQGSEATYAATMDEVRRILVERFPACEREAIQRCRDARDPGILVQFWLANTEAGVQVAIPAAAEMQRRAERTCRPEGFAIDLRADDLPLRTGNIGTSGTMDFVGHVRGCPTDDGTWAITGTGTSTYSSTGRSEDLTLHDVPGNQDPAGFTLDLSTIPDLELHRQLAGAMGDEISRLTVTDATGTPRASLTLYNGLGDHVGDFPVEATPVEPDCGG